MLVQYFYTKPQLTRLHAFSNTIIFRLLQKKLAHYPMNDGVTSSTRNPNIGFFVFVYYTQQMHNYTITIYRVSQEEWTKLRESVPYYKLYRYNPKHPCPKLNGNGDKGQRKVWSFCGSTYCTWFA